MKRIVTIKFKDGRQITLETKSVDTGLLSLGNGFYFIPYSGTLYKRKDNVICGEDITDTVDSINIFMKY